MYVQFTKYFINTYLPHFNTCNQNCILSMYSISKFASVFLALLACDLLRRKLLLLFFSNDRTVYMLNLFQNTLLFFIVNITLNFNVIPFSLFLTPCFFKNKKNINFKTLKSKENLIYVKYVHFYNYFYIKWNYPLQYDIISLTK